MALQCLIDTVVSDVRKYFIVTGLIRCTVRHSAWEESDGIIIAIFVITKNKKNKKTAICCPSISFLIFFLSDRLAWQVGVIILNGK